MNNNTRITAALLAALTLAGLASCGGDTSDTPNTNTDAVTTAAVTEAETAPMDSLEARKLVSDDVPELDFGGKDFRIAFQEYYYTDALPTEAQENGDTINDAVYRRNMTIEERFNVKITGFTKPYAEVASTVMNTISAGEDAYDLYINHMIESGKIALAGYFSNWYDIPYINFEKPWFPNEANEQLELNGRIYMAMSDMCLSYAQNTYCVFFNKEMLNDYDITDMYDVVRDGKWTLDKLADISKQLYRDVNGDGTADEGDQFGFGSPLSTHCTTWLFSCDVPTVQFHDDGTVTSVFSSDRAVLMMEKLRDLYNNNVGSYLNINKNKNEDDMEQAFLDGKIGIITNGLILADYILRDAEFDYGIIPYPKLDEAQEAYYTVPGGGSNCFAAPITASDKEFVGAISTALSRESWVSVLPAYDDIVLKVKGARDEASIEMLDLILEGRAVSTSYMYDSWNGYNYKMADLVKGTRELASYTKSSDKSVIKHYEKVAALFYSDPIE